MLSLAGRYADQIERDMEEMGEDGPIKLPRYEPTHMSKKSATQNSGANAERTAIRAWARRSVVSRESLIAYLAGRSARYNKKAGGLGRKK